MANAVQQNAASVQNLFSSAAGAGGIGTQLHSLLNNAAGTGGTLATEQGGLQSDVNNINNQLQALKSQATALTAQYNAEFNAMDSIVAAYKNTQNLLTQLYAPRTTTSSSSSGG